MKKWNMTDRVFLKRLLWVALTVLVLMYSGWIFGILRVIWAVILPLVIGSAVAFVLNLILRNLEKIWFPHSKRAAVRKSRRGVCIVLSLMIIAAAVTILINVIVPELVKVFVTISGGIPDLYNTVRDWIIQHAEEYPQIQEQLLALELDWGSIMGKVSSVLTQGINQLVSAAFSTVGSMVTAIINLFVAVIFAIYVLAGKEKLGSQIRRLANAFLKPDVLRRCGVVLRVANDSFTSFFVGQFVEAIILGTLCFLGMSLLRFPYASMIGTLVGATALIPILGAYIGAGVGALMIVMVSPLKAIEFLVFIVVLQQLEGNLIYPRVVGTSIGLPGIWVFAAVMIGSGVAGIAGVLLGVPVAATCYKLIRIVTEEREEKIRENLAQKESESAEISEEHQKIE